MLLVGGRANAEHVFGRWCLEREALWLHEQCERRPNGSSSGGSQMKREQIECDSLSGGTAGGVMRRPPEAVDLSLSW